MRTSIIVVDSLEPLWQTNVSGHYLAAVTNVFQHDHFHRVEQLGLGGPEVYFNSGVMLLDPDEWRREGATEAVIEYALASHDKLDWPEQDALNVVLGHRRLPLHPRWNCMNSILQFPWAVDVFEAVSLEDARRRPAVRHFEGPSINKPWHYMCERGMRDLYFAHRRATPWPRVRLEGMTPGNVWRRWARRRRPPVSA